MPLLPECVEDFKSPRDDLTDDVPATLDPIVDVGAGFVLPCFAAEDAVGAVK